MDERSKSLSIRAACSFSWNTNNDANSLIRVGRVFGTFVTASFRNYTVRETDAKSLINQNINSYFAKEYGSKIVTQRIEEPINPYEQKKYINRSLSNQSIPLFHSLESISESDESQIGLHDNTSDTTTYSLDDEDKPIDATILQVNRFKEEENLSFTITKMTNGQDVELLNSLPDDVLKLLGIPCADKMVKIDYQGKVLSDTAITALDLDRNKVLIKTRDTYLGLGGDEIAFGSIIKFARIKTSDGKYKIIAAKKINHQHKQQKCINKADKEINILQTVGDTLAPRSYGISHRLNKRGSLQSIIFMDIAGTCAATTIIPALKKSGKHSQKLALLLLKHTQNITHKGIYPVDLTWTKICLHLDEQIIETLDTDIINLPGNYFDENQCKMKTIGFGDSITTKEMPQNIPGDVYFKNPPELGFDEGGGKQPVTISSEKVVVWRLGLMIMNLFTTKRRRRRSQACSKAYLDNLWIPDNKEENEKTFKTLEQLDFNLIRSYSPKFILFKPILLKMLSLDPDDRYTLDKACSEFERLIASQELGSS